MTQRAKTLFPLAWILTSIVIIVIIKWIVPNWLSFHIAIAAVSVLIVMTSLLRIWKMYSNRWVYIAWVVIVSTAPVFIGVVAGTNISQAVCFLRGSNSFRNLTGISANQDVTVCGYFNGCSSANFGQDQHVWEVCRIVDPIDSESSVLVYTYDITVNLDNPFDWSSLNIYGDGTLIVETGRLVGSINHENCTVDMFCNTEILPLVEIVRN